MHTLGSGSPADTVVETGRTNSSDGGRGPSGGDSSSAQKKKVPMGVEIMWGYMTKFYLVSRVLAFFFLFQMTFFVGFVICGATINFIVSTIYVTSTIEKYVGLILVSGTFVLGLYIFPVYCWFAFRLIKKEANYLGKIKKQVGGDKQSGSTQTTSLTWWQWAASIASMITLAISLILLVVYLIYSSGNNGKTGMILMSILLVLIVVIEVCFGFAFTQFYFMSKSFVAILVPTVAALIVTVAKKPYVFLNNFCFYFITISSVIFFVYFLLNSFPLFIWTFVKILLKKGKRCEITFTNKDFGTLLFDFELSKLANKCQICKIVPNVIVSVFSLVFLIPVLIIQFTHPWEGSDMRVYYTLGFLWLIHVIFYWISFCFIRSNKGLVVLEDKTKEKQNQQTKSQEQEQVKPQEQQHAQSQQVNSHEQQQTQSNQKAGQNTGTQKEYTVLDCVRFHLRNQRVDSLMCELITNLVFLILIVLAIYFIVGRSAEIDQLIQNNNVQLYNNVNNQKNMKLFRVDVCWPDMFGLSWLDYAYISRIAYRHSGLDFSKMTKLFEDRGFTITTNDKIIHYAILHNTMTNLTIVSFRGTSSKLDAIHDAKIFIEAIIPTLAVPFFPLPFQTKEWIGRRFAYTGSRAWSGGPLSLVKNGNEVVTRLVEQYGADNVVVTGHSLGGGLATIIGTTNNLTNYGVSPPGSGIGKFMNKYSQEQVVRYVHALVPQRDPVAALGSQQGSVVRIPCREPDSFSCHGLDATICMLSSICGDRYLAESCAPYWNRWQNEPKDDSLSP